MRRGDTLFRPKRPSLSVTEILGKVASPDEITRRPHEIGDLIERSFLLMPKLALTR